MSCSNIAFITWLGFVCSNVRVYPSLFHRNGIQFLVLKRIKNYHSTQPVFTCSKLTIETVEQVVKYVQNQQ